MTAPCPDCRKPVEITVTHTGVSTDGSFQRAMLEASHSAPVCERWKATQHDLVALASGSGAPDTPTLRVPRRSTEG